MTEKTFDVIVIGSGPGGSACAVLLAKAGLKTLMLEKNGRVGGKMLTGSKNGFEYDIWPHGQVPINGAAFETLFKILGVESERKPCLEHNSMKKVCGISYRAKEWSKYRSVAFVQGLKDALPFFQMWEMDEAEQAAAIKFMADMAVMPPEQVDELDDVSMHDYCGQNDVPFRLYSYLAFHANASLAEPIDLVSASEQIKIMQQIMIQGGGGNYKGGFGRLTDIIAREFQKLGGELITRAKVERIKVEDGRVTGVVTKDATFDAPIVVSSAGIQPTVLKLAGEEHFDASYTRYIKDLVPGWAFTGVRYFLNRDVLDLPMYVAYADESWWNVERFEAAAEGRIPDEVILFMTVAANYDPDMAPPGKQCIVAGTICSPDPESKQIGALCDKMDEMMQRLYPDAWAAVESVERAGPAEISSSSRDSVLPGQGGECVGLAQIVGQCGKNKPSPQSPIPGLYYVGADAGSAGMGTHQAADSGMKVADMVIQECTRSGSRPNR
ncbi:MAG: NAD(P)/FAD-dependent oxidoreductase [Chloroflexi bacterium]|nr:NAD(P)/FAD-dependent oxidoreductase [Chloroflexota bacterium]